MKNKGLILLTLTLLTLLLMFLVFPSYLCAENEAQVSPLKKILENAENLDNAEDKINEFFTIYNLDVFGYFDLEGKYDTDLKKKVFKKSSEYQERLNELKAKKQEIQKRIYYISMSGGALSDYDIKKKGFNLTIGGNMEFTPLTLMPPKTIKNIHFPFLPVKNTPWRDWYLPAGLYWEQLFIPMSEKHGLSIENNKENIKIFFIFKIDDAKELTHKTYLFRSSGWVRGTKRVLVANTVRVVIGNEQSGEVYFDKVYSSAKK